MFDSTIAYWLLGLSPEESLSHEDLERKLMENKLDKIFNEIEMPLISVLAKMKKIGIGLDQKEIEKLKSQYQRETKILEQKIKQIAGEDFNLNSPKQLSSILFEKIKVQQSGRRTKTGLRSTNSEILSDLKDDHPIINLILDYREKFKLLSTYLEPLGTLGDRAYTTFLQTGTATGRLSSQNPNLQNIPPILRKVFVADKDYKLASFDYSQIELRVMASVAGDEKMIEAFQNEIDIHSLTASQVFKVSLDKVTKEMRNLAKTLNFGVIYGMGAAAFAKTSGLKKNEAENFIREYFNNFNQIKNWQQKIKNQLKENGFVENLNGRRRWLLNIFSNDSWQVAEAERAAINMPIQSLAADIIKMAMIKIDNELPWRMLLTIHDELLFEIENDKLKESIPQIQKIMENVYKLAVPIKVGISVGDNWGELEKHNGMV